jgi:O-antigen/teichoic acid export membrane protein
MAISLLVGIWIVRYFGPEYFGKFNYVNAWLTLMAAMIPLGTESIIVSELVKDSDNKDTILSTSFVLYFFTGLIFTLLSIAFVIISKPNDLEIFSLIWILSIPYFLRCLTVPRYFYESNLSIKRIVLIENAYLIVFTFIKIYFLIFSYPFIYFIWSFSIEGILISLTVFISYNFKKLSIKFKYFSWIRTKSIISSSFSLFLSSLAIILYMKVDQIMIGNMLGNKELGYYSVAVRLSELWYFVPVAISTSFYPLLIKLYQDDKFKYWYELQRLHTILFLLSFIVALTVQIFADYGILLLYGDKFSASADVLKLHVWSGIFVFLGMAGSNHFVINNIQKYSFFKSLVGLITNIGLNFFLIPLLGIIGAAIATLISQFFASTLFLLFFKVLRPLFFQQVKSLNLFEVYSFLKIKNQSEL